MTRSEHNIQPLLDLLRDNYNCLNRQYRYGKFEEDLNYVSVLQSLNSSFYVLTCEPHAIVQGKVSFKKAIENLYKLILHIKVHSPETEPENGILILRCRNLIYEACDYALSVPPELEDYYVKVAERLSRGFGPQHLEKWSEELNGGQPFGPDLDEQTKVIKDLLIAALCAANHYFRQHHGGTYDTALHLLEKIQTYVEVELPRQHAVPRKSFGLLGLTLYLQGKVLMAQGSYAKSRVALRQSAEAYVDRLRQKEALHKEDKDKLSLDDLKEKTLVTLRRVALVTAFGDGYLSYLNGEIDRALQALTLARAALTQNSGKVYLTYVDVWYWACQRAKNSSNLHVIERAVSELQQCYLTLRKLAPGSSYLHWTGVELALALYYKGRLSPKDSEKSFKQGLKRLRKAILYAKQLTRHEQYKNPHVLADALIFQSYFYRARFRSKRRTAQRSDLDRDLNEAKEAALKATNVAMRQGTAPLKSEAYAALGAVCTDFVEFRKETPYQFYKDFDEAMAALKESLRHNVGNNIRLEAASYLRLARLCLLNGNTTILGFENFEKWTKLESRVEHAYLKKMAAGIRTKHEVTGDVFLIRTARKQTAKEWEEQVSEFLIEHHVNRFISLHESEKKHTEDSWLQALMLFLRDNLDYDIERIKEEIESRKLIDILMNIRQVATKSFERGKLKRFPRLERKE